MSKLYLCSFASPDLNASKIRFIKQSNTMNFYNDVKIYGFKDLSDQKKIQIEKLMKYRKRLFGYASWKPEIILDYLDRIPEDAILQYSDIGCHLNKNGIERLKYYQHITEKENILGFQYFKPNFTYKKKLRYQIYYENLYTKNDLFEYLNISDNSEIRKSEQIWSGSIFFKNNNISKNFLKKWIDICKINHLIDDTPSKTKNINSFVEHRHDQSVFSILGKLNKIHLLSASECEWAEDENGRYWTHLDFFPILAKRDKKLNMFKRFYLRQIKNYQKLFKK